MTQQAVEFRNPFLPPPANLPVLQSSISYSYDGLNRLTEIAVSTPGSVPEMGNNTVKADIAGTGTKPGAIIRFSYDPSGRRISKTILTSDLRPLTSVRYLYDKSGQLLSIEDKFNNKQLSGLPGLLCMI